MVSARTAVKIHFDRFTLDLDSRQLLCGRRELHLSPKAFDLLGILTLDRPRVLSKTVLQQRLWPDTFVAEANLSNLIAEIREALGDPARKPRFIRTAHRHGYAFCASAQAEHQHARPPLHRPACWLEWGDRRFPLQVGEHLVGRDADVEIQLDAPTVSRRHARLLVTEDEAVLEDFSSKNGTFHGDARVARPVHLADGDAIRFGSVLVTFHTRTPATATDTRTAATRSRRASE